MNIDRYIRQSVRRELAARRYRDSRRRHIDYCAYSIRHNDGIKDIVSKAIDKCKELINQFKALPAGRKIVVILSRVLQGLSVFFSAKSALEFKARAKELDKMKADVQTAYNEATQLADEVQMRSLNEENSALQGYFGDRKRVAFIKAGFKILVGLLGVLSGTVVREIAVKTA